MNKINACLWVIACLLFLSCKKDLINTPPKILSQPTALSVSKESTWQGAFLSYNGHPPTRFIPDNYFIENGYARIYSDSVHINKQNYYGTLFKLVIPSNIFIKGDSINFEVGVKNPFNSSFYSPYYGRDVSLYIKGKTNEALINCVTTSDINPDAHKRAAIKLGHTTKNNITELQHNFEDFDTLIMQTFNFGIKVYLNDSYLNGLSYNSDDRKEPLIGRLQEIGVIFKGSGFIDYVKIFNSVNGSLLMSEDFNTDGESTVIWH